MAVAIKIENLSKQYRLGLVSTRTLSHDLNRWWQTSIMRREDPYLKIGQENKLNTHNSQLTSHNSPEYVWALKDINLEVHEGEVLGIIGRNGAGKSTLLKILSRVTGPTTGIVKVRGRIASLLEVGTGFHQEMTGRENVFMNGAIMGMTRNEIRKKFDEIVDFAGVERYIDTPVKRYSSGMTVRLGFAVAAHLEPEILVVDEVLAVGDAEFQNKAIGKMQDVSQSKGKTVLFVSHNMGSIAKLCSRGILLQNGVIEFNGQIESTINTYLQNDRVKSNFFINNKSLDKEAYLAKIRIVDENHEGKNSFFYDEPVFVSFEIVINQENAIYSLFCMILDKKLNRVFAAENSRLSKNMLLKINPNFLVRGEYSIHAFINLPGYMAIDTAENVCSFKIVDNGSDFVKHGDYDYGPVFGNYEWI